MLLHGFSQCCSQQGKGLVFSFAAGVADFPLLCITM
jgi:hypothetical protein